MNKDQIKGAVQIVAGLIQEEAGTLINSPKQFVKGLRRQVAGESQRQRGDVREIVEKMKPKLSRRAQSIAGAGRGKRTPGISRSSKLAKTV